MSEKRSNPDDPYGDIKLYHYGAKISRDGMAVSALCYSKPRAIPLGRETWTITPGAVTCPKCKDKLRALYGAKERESGK